MPADYMYRITANDTVWEPGTYFGIWEEGNLVWYLDTPEQIQERIDKAKQLKEDKKRYPLFFWKEGINEHT